MDSPTHAENGEPLVLPEVLAVYPADSPAANLLQSVARRAYLLGDRDRLVKEAEYSKQRLADMEREAGLGVI